MATYDHKQVLADYANGKITPEMAVGHSLQHIAKLYEAQAAAITERHAEQARLDALEARVQSQQTVLDRLTAFMEKVLRTQKQHALPSRPKPAQP